MAAVRAWSKVAAPHRILFVDPSGDYQRGEDVRALQAAANRRLNARGMGRYATREDGVLGPDAALAFRKSVWALGAMNSTVLKIKPRGGRITLGAQRMIRWPGTRTPVQLGRARARMRELADQDAPDSDVTEQRARAKDAALFALSKAPRHYTQGPSRWNPIASEASPVTGKMWSYADCSSFATWVLWHALGRGGEDTVNGQDWRAGYTGTQLRHGWEIREPSHSGDLVFYGNGWPGKHVAVYVGNGLVVSHGSEGGPYLVPVHYRSDVMGVRRYLS